MGPASRPRGSECHCPVRWRQPQEGSRGQACVGSRSRSQDCRRCRVGSADRHPNAHEQHLLRAQHSPTRCWECTEGPRPRVTPKEQFSLLYSELIALCKHALAGVCLGGGEAGRRATRGGGRQAPAKPGRLAGCWRHRAREGSKSPRTSLRQGCVRLGQPCKAIPGSPHSLRARLAGGHLSGALSSSNTFRKEDFYDTWFFFPDLEETP